MSYLHNSYAEYVQNCIRSMSAFSLFNDRWNIYVHIFSEQNGFYRQSSLCMQHILNSFRGTCAEGFFGKFLVCYFWFLSAISQSCSFGFSCLLFPTLSKWSHAVSIIFRSGLSGGQSVAVKASSALAFLSLFTWRLPVHKDHSWSRLWSFLSLLLKLEYILNINYFCWFPFDKCLADSKS